MCQSLHPMQCCIAGLQDLTLRSLAVQQRTLVPLSRLQQLSR